MFDCEFIIDPQGHQSILDWSDKSQAVVVIPQAKGFWGKPYTSPTWRGPTDRLRTLWDPNSPQEYHFLEKMIEDIQKLVPFIDRDNIHVWGFSNGAYLTASLALLCRGAQFGTETHPWFSHGNLSGAETWFAYIHQQNSVGPHE